MVLITQLLARGAERVAVVCVCVCVCALLERVTLVCVTEWQRGGVLLDVRARRENAAARTAWMCIEKAERHPVLMEGAGQRIARRSAADDKNTPRRRHASGGVWNLAA